MVTVLAKLAAHAPRAIVRARDPETKTLKPLATSN